MATRPPKTGILMIKEIAEYHKVTERISYRLPAATKIPMFKAGRGWGFSRAVVNDSIREQSTTHRLPEALQGQQRRNAWVPAEFRASIEIIALRQQ
jgi:hypothetical protein